jgi:hypothetical protein
VTALCVGSPLAINIKAVLSPFGIGIVLLIFGFHSLAFILGYSLAGVWFNKSDDVKALQRTVSYETGLLLSVNTLVAFYHELISPNRTSLFSPSFYLFSLFRDAK